MAHFSQLPRRSNLRNVNIHASVRSQTNTSRVRRVFHPYTRARNNGETILPEEVLEEMTSTTIETSIDVNINLEYLPDGGPHNETVGAVSRNTQAMPTRRNNNGVVRDHAIGHGGASVQVLVAVADLVNPSAAAANEGGIEAGTSARTDAMMDVDVQVEEGSSEEEEVHAAIAFKNEYAAVKKEDF